MDRSAPPGEGVRSLESALQHLRWVRQLAAVLVGGGADADDVAQEAWRRALENPPPATVAWKAWLGGVVRHTAKDRRRAEQRRVQREFDVAAPEGSDDDAAALLERVEEERALVQLVASLEEPYRTLLLRRFFDGWSIAKIAEVDGTPEATVRTRLRRGLDRLRERAVLEHGTGAERWLAGIAFVAPRSSAVVSAASLSPTWALLPTALIMLKIAGLMIAVASLAFVALGPETTDAPESVHHREVANAAPADSLVAIAGDGVRSQIASVEAPLPTQDLDSTTTSTAPISEESGLLVRGQVLTGQEPLEVDGCNILLSSLDPARNGTALAQIGSDGRFEVRVGSKVASEGERVGAFFTGGDLIRRLSIEFELRSEVVLKLPPTLRAHGRLSTTPAVSFDEAFIRLNEVDEIRFLGRCKVEANGEFSFPIRLQPWMVQVGFKVYVKGRLVLEDVVELATLTSAHGLHYDFEMALVDFAVKDREGSPIAGARLVLDSVPESAFQQPPVELGAAGTAELHLPLKSFAYVVQAPGHVTSTGRFDAELRGAKTQRVEVVMSPSSGESLPTSPVRLYGTVTLGGTNRVEGAFISASAQADAWSVGHALYFEGVRTDENGDFELMLPRPGVYMVTAAHSGGGPITETRPLSVMHDLRFDADLTPESRVNLRPTGAIHDLPQTHGFVEWQSVQERGDSLTRSRSGSPHFLTVRPDRSYRVMGRLTGTDLFGATQIDSAAITLASPIAVPFAQAPIASGTLLDSSGTPVAGAQVMASSGAGSYRLAPESWRSATTDESGGFKIFALGGLDGEETVELTVEPGPWGPRCTRKMNLSGHATLTLD